MYHVMAYWRLSNGLFHFCRNLLGICHLIPSRQNGHPKSPSFWHCCRHYIYIIPHVYVLWNVCRYDGRHDWRFHNIHHIVRNQTYLWLQKTKTQRIEDGLDQRSTEIILIETATVSCNKVVSAVTVGQVTWSLQPFIGGYDENSIRNDMWRRTFSCLRKRFHRHRKMLDTIRQRCLVQKPALQRQASASSRELRLIPPPTFTQLCEFQN